jgi:uncharacterized protein (DUF1778 family)
MVFREGADMARHSTAAKRKAETKRTGTINIRTTARERALIDQAAAAQGKTRSDFMLEAAHREAVDTILNKTLFQVDAAIYKKFAAMLDAPPKGNAKLRELMQTNAPWE